MMINETHSQRGRATKLKNRGRGMNKTHKQNPNLGGTDRHTGQHRDRHTKVHKKSTLLLRYYQNTRENYTGN